MTGPTHSYLKTVALMLVVSAPIAAHASVSWNFTSGGTNSGSSYGNERTFTSGGQTVSATGWSDTGGTNDDQIQDARLGRWSGGLGVENRDSGDSHTMDNINDFDFILFDFSSIAGQTFSMETVSVGYAPNDSDVSVLAYTGTSAPPAVSGKTFEGSGGLLEDGWELVSHISNVTSQTNDTGVVQNPAAVSSSWWIVSAYNPAFGAPSNWTTGNDKVKISALSGFFEETQNGGGGTPGVPEPSSLLLLGLGLPLLRGLRRRG